jgi:hypothetical protein
VHSRQQNQNARVDTQWTRRFLASLGLTQSNVSVGHKVSFSSYLGLTTALEKS